MRHDDEAAMLTDEQLHAIMPRVSDTKGRELLPFLQAAMTECAIDRPAREAAFLAQVAHESGQFQFMQEIWGPTDAQRRYEPPSTLATRLGNTEPGDGRRFKGRGPIQITGRANYRRFGDLLGVDLVSDPERAALPDLAFRIASLFWMKKGLNELADRATADAFREITKRINGGLNGLTDRERFYAVARTVLGVTDVPLTRGPGRPSEDTPEPAFERGHEAVRAESRSGRDRTREIVSPRKTGARPITKTRRAATRKASGAARAPLSRSPGKTAGTGQKAARSTSKGRRTGSSKPRRRRS
jgi:putative chitinase